MLVHYFSCSGGSSMDFTNSVLGHVTPNLCFSIRCDLRVMYCILLHLEHEISTHYFACSRGPSAVSTKTCPDTLYGTCVLHLVGSVGQIVHSVATRPRKCRCTIFHARVGPVRIQQIAR
jgi:hypothetical protein